MTFTRDELIALAKDAFGGEPTVERDGLTYRFEVPYDDRSAMDYVNGMDALGRLAWPVRNRYTGNEERPADFTGAARKFGPTNMHDTVWWEPYREGSVVYDDPDTVEFMRDLLDYGVVGCKVTVARKCECCNGDVEVGSASLWGVESPLIGKGNYEYLAEVFDELIAEALDEEEVA